MGYRVILGSKVYKFDSYSKALLFKQQNGEQCMNRFQSKSNLIGDIERSITDIARRCDVKNTDVINEIKDKYFNKT